MALAQLWSGNYPMPSQAEIESEADASIARLAKLVKYGDVKITGVMGHMGFDQWLNEVAGTGLYDYLGNWTNSKCWKLWWSDRKLYNILMTGIISTHMLRLFDTGRGRKAWRGARKAIIEANENAARFEKSESLKPKKA
jgi:dimethylaniline monooxygenase (N-oxide forming)